MPMPEPVDPNDMFHFQEYAPDLRGGFRFHTPAEINGLPWGGEAIIGDTSPDVDDDDSARFFGAVG